MTKETALEKIKHNYPRLIYLSGKTCTGKTTFANLLKSQGYEKIELDKVVVDSVVTPFGTERGVGFHAAYRGDGPAEQTAAFISATKVEILSSLQKSSLVIEGSVATSKILGEIFSGDLKNFLFIYLHPVHSDEYEKRITLRFVAGAKNGTAGLPKSFWELVRESDLDEFLNTGNVNSGIQTAIKNYAAESMKESATRLKNFQASFPEIAVVEI